MNGINIHPMPNVKIAIAKPMKNHLMSPRISGTNTPKNKLVHENPIGAVLTTPVSLCFKLIFNLKLLS